MDKKDKPKLLGFLNSRKTIAEKWTKEKYIDQANLAQDDYDREPIDGLIVSANSVFATKRYEYVVPIVFNNVESYKASMLDQTISIIFTGRGKQDDEKSKKVSAAYEYLEQLLDLENFQIDAAHNFSLTGFVTSLCSFKNEIKEVPLIDELTGEVVLDEAGKPVMRAEYVYNDPVLDLAAPEEVFFSPDSEIKNNREKIPYYFYKILMDPAEIKKIYNKKVNADHKIVDDGRDDTESERTEVFLYCGSLPEEYKTAIEGWREDKEVFVAMTKSKILYIGEAGDQKWITCQKFYGKPKNFFGYGLGKTLHQFQKERSIRRSQLMRIGDQQAYQKWLIRNDEGNNIDLDALQDPTNVDPVLYEKEPPRLSEQPQINAAVLELDSRADNEAQQTSGMLDISAGGQQSVVKTATGQTMFTEASEKKVRLAKKLFARFYKKTVIKLLKLCQQNWDEDKLVQITDDNGEEQEVILTKNDLADIDFDKDIEFEIESPTFNKDLIRAQSIDLYDRMKQSPLVDQNELIKFIFSEGYGKKGDRFLKKNDLQPGMRLVGQDGRNYVVDESGNVVAQEALEQTDQSVGTSGGGEVPSNLGNYMGANL